MVATGRAEVMIDPVMNLWDAAPLQTVIEEAGGKFTDWQGHPTVHSGESIATNGLIADEVLAVIRGRLTQAFLAQIFSRTTIAGPLVDQGGFSTNHSQALPSRPNIGVVFGKMFAVY